MNAEPQQWFALATLLVAAGIYLMLPRGAARGWLLGVVLATGGFVLGAWKLPALRDWVENSLFAVLAGVTVLGAVGTITFRSPVYCALWFGLSLLGTAALFLASGAQFLAAATVVVYAGAILVTFLFVLMLAQPRGQAAYDRTSWEALISAGVGVVLVGILSVSFAGVFSGSDPAGEPPTAAALAPLPQDLQQHVLAPAHVSQLGGELFGRHLIAVELAGILLLAALVGATSMAVKPRTPPQE